MNLSFKISIILSGPAITISLPSDAASLGAITLSLNNSGQDLIKGFEIQQNENIRSHYTL